MKLGCIGLGQMGAPMAANLDAAGHDVTLYNRTRRKAEDVAQRTGARIAGSPAAAAMDADAVITMLSDDAAVEAVVFGAGGFLEALPRGAIHICSTTISVACSRLLVEAHREAGHRYVSAPVFGRPDIAAQGKLRVVAAGPPDALETCRPIFDAIGQQTFDLGGDVAAANLAKLLGNFLLAAAIEAMGEAFAAGSKMEIEPGRLLDIYAALFQSPIYAGYGRLMVDRTFTPAGFGLRLGLKDIRLALEAARELEAPMPLASLVHDRLLAATARGHGEADWSVVSLISAEAAGLE